MPLISIILPVYNVEPYIEECLESILSQDFDDYEINLVDNGSDDRSAEICERYARSYPSKINFDKLPKPTVFARAAHRALEMASGDYIFYIDSDDYINPGCLQHVAKIIKEKNVDIVMFDFTCVVEEGLLPRYGAVYREEEINDIPYLEAIKNITLNRMYQPIIWNMVIKHSVHGRADKSVLGIENSDVAGAFDFMLKAKSIYYIDKHFYTYRVRHGSITTASKNSDNARSFFLSMILSTKTIHYKHSYFSKEEIIEILNPMMSRYLKLTIGNCDLLDYSAYEIMSQALENINSNIRVFKRFEYFLFSKLHDFVSDFGAYLGLLMFFDYEKNLLIADTKKIMDKKVYVMPLGAYGQSAAKIIRNMGVEVHGFLDNGEAKAGQIIDEIPCYLPAILNSDQNLDDVAVVIASVHDIFVESILEQLITIGVKEENIVIRGEQR